MNIEDLKNPDGNVIKIQCGKRTFHYAYDSITLKNNAILCYQVDKHGNTKISNYGHVYEKWVCLSDIIELLPIKASMYWCFGSWKDGGNNSDY